MKQIIRIDRGDGTESVEQDDSRVRQTLNANYPPETHELMMTEFQNGNRSISNSYAIYECREVSA